MRGTDPIRRIEYRPSSEWYRTRPYDPGNADPYYYHEGDFSGVDFQPSAASVISISSNLVNTTGGTVAVMNGLTRITFSLSILNQNSIGLWIAFEGSTSKYYQIKSLDTVSSSTVCYLSDPYEGTSNAAATYNLGDVGQKVCVSGFDSTGSFIEETIILNGSTVQNTSTVFSELVKISKDKATYGRVTATSNGGAITNVALSPGEYENVSQSIIFYPVPTKEELISYEARIQHPMIYSENDTPLVPVNYHGYLVTELYIRMMTEFLVRDVSASVVDLQEARLQKMISIDNDTSNWEVNQESYDSSYGSIGTNLPTNYEVG